MLREISTTTLYAAVRLTPEFFEAGRSEPRRGTGTGFIVRERDGAGARKFLVTNRHVVDADYAKKTVTGWRLEALQISGHFQHPRHPGVDAVPQTARLADPVVRFPSKWDVDLAALPLTGGPELEAVECEGHFNSLPASLLATKEDFSGGQVTVGRQVLMPGYPGVDGMAADRPLLVGGVIATDPRYPAVIGPHVHEDQVLCHAFSWRGMSGSPVLCMVPAPPATWLDMEAGVSGMVVLAGVNAGHIDVRSEQTAGAISRFVRADALTDLLRAAGMEMFQHGVNGSPSASS
jgi:trypsin-like peptidase